MRYGNKAERGNAMVEFAIASSVIVLMALGALDFGRLFYDAMAVAGAAQAGVQRGTFSSKASGDTGEIKETVTAGLDDVEGATVTYEQFCDCPSAPRCVSTSLRHQAMEFTDFSPLTPAAC
jgi:Flp pilus assembly protein TadG